MAAVGVLDPAGATQNSSPVSEVGVEPTLRGTFQLKILVCLL